jgi:mersacidin/lichenicidin family type 2 lantibiotic
MLTPSVIVRAWKDQEFRESLSPEDRSCLPAHPSGLVELTDEDLGMVGGMTGDYCTPTCISNWYMCISDCPATLIGCGGGGGGGSHEGGCKPAPMGYGG